MNIFLATFLTDLILFIVGFFVMYRAGENNFSNLFCMLLGIANGFGYIAASLISGKIVNQKTSKPILIISTIVTVASCIALLCLKDFLSNFLLLVLMGASTSFYFNAFQSFIRNTSSRGEIFKTMSTYTFTWNSGIALGFLSSGSLYRAGPVALSVLMVICGIAIMGIINARRVSAETAVDNEAHSFNANPFYLWVGWIMIFSVNSVERSIQTFFPVISAQNNLSPFLSGIPLFLLMAAQGTFSLYLAKKKNLFYNKKAALLINLSGLLIFTALWLYPSYITYLVCFFLTGLYGSFCYMSAVVYANNHHENRSHNVGINETLVGISGITGVAMSSFFMEYFPGAGSLYLICALYIVAAIVYISLIPEHKKA
ncbi:MAG: hypothetical protein A2252_01900 [Elusimicrobia bacterium RIFOXYA2_FULL_39_19]|nr:MAG: hypothetical protein A2252_01900 [Elusimicrobia bacterium RIFOXYA2_FULL_39_19]